MLKIARTLPGMDALRARRELERYLRGTEADLRAAIDAGEIARLLGVLRGFRADRQPHLPARVARQRLVLMGTKRPVSSG